MCGYIVYSDGKRVSSVVSYGIACDIARQIKPYSKRYVRIDKTL